jgi:ABC-type branched-subunit amino acid transport system ATPase component
VSTEGLVVEGLTVRFGGHWAVQGVDLAAPQGTVTGLIGPNGAGKTTTFNACSGLLHPTEGAIRFAGVDVTRRSVPARARLGLGRTFQQLELYTSMTVRENVALGAEASRVGGNPLRQILGPRTDRQGIREAADAAIALCDLERVANERVDTLSTGWQRLTELARACAGNYRLLLLDEPSAGLDQRETEAFAAILRELVVQRHLGILLVEHDMSLVMAVCARIFVLDFGVLIFQGSPHEVQASATVRSAYLGSAEGLEGVEAEHAALIKGR